MAVGAGVLVLLGIIIGVLCGLFRLRETGPGDVAFGSTDAPDWSAS